MTGQPGNEAAEKFFVVDDAQSGRGMHDLVVPRRHMAVRLVLARIPVRRDVAVRAPEDDHHVGAVGEFGPERIGAGHVCLQRSRCAARRVEQERNVVGVESLGRVGDEHAQRVLADDPMEALDARFGEMRGQVHGRLVTSGAGAGARRITTMPAAWHDGNVPIPSNSAGPVSMKLHAKCQRRSSRVTSERGRSRCTRRSRRASSTAPMPPDLRCRRRERAQPSGDCRAPPSPLSTSNWLPRATSTRGPARRAESLEGGDGAAPCASRSRRLQVTARRLIRPSAPTRG